MAFETNNMSGALFKNDRKAKDSQPDYRGNYMINGVDYWMSAWLKTSKKGTKYFSFAFQEKEEQKIDRSKSDGATTHSVAGDFDDDIPF